MLVLLRVLSFLFYFTSHLGTLDLLHMEVNGKPRSTCEGTLMRPMRPDTTTIMNHEPWAGPCSTSRNGPLDVTNKDCGLPDFNAAARCRVSICISWAPVGQPAQVRHQPTISSRPGATSDENKLMCCAWVCIQSFFILPQCLVRITVQYRVTVRTLACWCVWISSIWMCSSVACHRCLQEQFRWTTLRRQVQLPRAPPEPDEELLDEILGTKWINNVRVVVICPPGK